MSGEISIHICKECNNGEYHGFKPKYASTIYFWCPIKEHHDAYRECTSCENFVEGQPKCFDNRGNQIEMEIKW